MKRAFLPFFACPGTRGKPHCGGSLSVSDGDGLPLVERKEDLIEGMLRCGRCGSEFPLLSGVAVLVPEPEAYVRRYHRAIRRDLQRHGCLSVDAKNWLGRRSGAADQDDYGADFRFSQQFEQPWNLARTFTSNPSELYGPFAEWLQTTQGHGPYDVLAEWAGSLRGARHLLLDAGCGGGGLVARVAPRYASVLGVDYSFLAILLARRAVLHLPEPERSYYLPVKRGQEIERPLSIPQSANAELVVGDCCALPFPEGLFDTVCSANVIDIAGIERPLDEAARALRPDGLLLLSDPFYFRDGEAPAGEPREAVRDALRNRQLTPEVEADGVPWAWATYDRHWRIYFNYCVAARRVAA